MTSGFACSPQQRALLALVARDGERPYRARCELLLDGALDHDRLHRAVGRVVARHEVLRTTVQRPPGLGVPAQVVEADPRFDWEVADLRDGGAAGGPAAGGPAAVEAAHRARHEAPFDLGRPPLLRCSLLRRSEVEHVLVLTLPAVLTDTEGLGVLAGEIAEAYQSGSGGGDLSPVDLQYPDLAAVFEDFLHGEQWEDGRRFWERAPALVAAALPFESEVPWPYDPRVVPVPLAAGAAGVIERIAATAGVGEDAVLLAAWRLLGARLTGHDDLVIGAVLGGRTFEELGEAPGLCARRVPVAVPLAVAARFLDLVATSGAALATAGEWQDYLDPQVAGRVAGPSGSDSAADRGAAIGLSYTGPWAPRTRGGVTFTLLERVARIDRCTLDLVARRDPDGLVLALSYDAARLEELAVRRWAVGFATLLGHLDPDGAVRVGHLPLVGAAEREEVLHVHNRTARRWSGPTLLSDLFAEQASTVPDRVAVVADSGTLTYAALAARVDRLARRLSEGGVGPEVPVAVTARRSLRTVIAMLAVTTAGGCVVPIDPDIPPARREAMLAKAGVASVVDGEPAGGAHGGEAPGGEAARGIRVDVPPDSLIAVLHTSGSGGEPKAVMLTHRGLHNRIRWGQEAAPLATDDRVLHSASFAFDFALWELFAPLVAGATIVLADADTQVSSSGLVGLMAREAVTTAHFVPSLLRLVVDEPGLARCHHLRRVYAGGEVLRRPWAERLLEAIAVDLVNQYGPTEASVDVTAGRVPRGQGGAAAPIGHPIANMRAYVLDAALQPLPLGATGELYVAGQGLARGYAGDAAVTAERFVADPFSTAPGARMYRTGDLARRLAGGALEVVGRSDGQVKVRGFRIEPQEIEAALEQHPDVRGAAVAAWDRAGDRRLVGYVERGGGRIDVAGLRGYLQQRLPPYMVPNTFVELAALPRTSSGKLDRRALPEPGPGRPELGQEYVAPRSATEERVAAIWADLLGLDRVGVFDDFLQLGGHSLLATQLVSRVEEAFGSRLSLLAFFDEPNVAAVAAAITAATGATGPRQARASLRDTRRRARTQHLVALQPGGHRRPLFLVHPVSGGVSCYGSLAEALGPGQPVYGLAASGLAEGSAPLDDVSRMAERYVDAVRGVQPAGPYLLGGWSFGGMVALEMARLLSQAGGAVPVLVLIDTPAPPGPPEVPAALDAEMLLAIAADVAALMRRPLSVDAASLEAVDAEQRVPFLLERMVADGLLPGGGQRRNAERQLATYRAHTAAWCGYAPAPYDGHATLFRTREWPGETGQEQVEGWRTVVGRLQEQVVAGRHYTMLEPPQVDDLARALRSLTASATHDGSLSVP